MSVIVAHLMLSTAVPLWEVPLHCADVGTPQGIAVAGDRAWVTTELRICSLTAWEVDGVALVSERGHLGAPDHEDGAVWVLDSAPGQGVDLFRIDPDTLAVTHTWELTNAPGAPWPLTWADPVAVRAHQTPWGETLVYDVWAAAPTQVHRYHVTVSGTRWAGVQWVPWWGFSQGLRLRGARLWSHTVGTSTEPPMLRELRPDVAADKPSQDHRSWSIPYGHGTPHAEGWDWLGPDTIVHVEGEAVRAYRLPGARYQ